MVWDVMALAVLLVKALCRLGLLTTAVAQGDLNCKTVRSHGHGTVLVFCHPMSQVSMP